MLNVWRPFVAMLWAPLYDFQKQSSLRPDEGVAENGQGPTGLVARVLDWRCWHLGP